MYNKMAYGKKGGMRSKRTYRSRSRTTNNKKGLTKKEKTQTRQIAKSVVNKMAETKYFNVAKSLGELSMLSAWTASTLTSEISVLGFTTGFEKAKLNPTTDQGYKYGVNSSGSNINMDSLELNRIYTINSTDPIEVQMAIQGTTIRPSYAESHWLLQRQVGVVPNLGYAESVANPYKVRMIRCRPRAKKGSYIEVNPRLDLFLDQDNREFGISSTLPGTSAQMFNAYEFNLAKTNSRKYQILEDTTFIMGANSTATATGSVTQPYNVQPGLASSCKVIKRRHNIGKEFYYSDPNAVVDEEQYPQDGFTAPEFILFHVLSLGNPGVEGVRQRPELLKISCRPVSTFKDI